MGGFHNEYTRESVGVYRQQDYEKQYCCVSSFHKLKPFLRYEDFVLFNSRGSHRTYHREDGKVLTVVQPHGQRKTCSAQDIRRLLKVLGL